MGKIAEYGALSYLTGPKIGSLVDWCIDQYWLDIEYTRDGIPLLFTTDKGWERAKGIWARRVLGWFDEWASAGTPENVWPRLEKINQQIKHLILELIEKEHRQHLVPVLRSWFPHEVRKVRQSINRTLQTLGQRPLPHPPKQ